ncbi:unnamed protein product [Paramecium octaurelia]|uniref:Uncharacterized protein n=1 Tax=Paramecium octaurelia TaxID=43137 RepID=A0A8S1VZW5_PAROT|nr:unnamed protein product [Paramecium octaurelia]
MNQVRNGNAYIKNTLSHSNRVIQALFIPSSTIKTLYLDEHGIIYKNAFAVMTDMDEFIITNSKDKICKNRNISSFKLSPNNQSSWWKDAKIIFKKRRRSF